MKLLNYSILFIEDDSVMRKNYSEVLRDRFKTVYEAADGFSAYSIYLEKKPDILIIDIDIPKLTGLELLQKIRKVDLNTKAIMLTSYDDTNTLLEATSLKLTQYLVKPIQRQKLFDALEKGVKEIVEFSISSNKILQISSSVYWDFRQEKIFVNNIVINITKKEKEILSLIFLNFTHNKITSYEDILFNVWDEYTDSTLKSLKTTMTNIRKKIPDDIISNEYGIGYTVII